MTDPELPLTGRRVLLTRPAGRGAGLVERLQDLGARVDARPTIALRPPVADEAARRAVCGLSDYDWLLFTSPAGVRFFFELRRKLHPAGAEITASIGAIGPGTASALEHEGHTPQVTAEESRSEGLAQALAGRLLPAQRVLVVRPEVARRVLIRSLERMGLRTDSVAFYRNVPAPELEGVVRDVSAGRFDAIVFTSPSTLERLLQSDFVPQDQLRTALRRSRLVAIGPVTARAIERAGLDPAAVADDPTDESLSRCIVSLFG